MVHRIVQSSQSDVPPADNAASQQHLHSVRSFGGSKAPTQHVGNSAQAQALTRSPARGINASAANGDRPLTAAEIRAARLRAVKAGAALRNAEGLYLHSRSTAQQKQGPMEDSRPASDVSRLSLSQRSLSTTSESARRSMVVAVRENWGPSPSRIEQLLAPLLPSADEAKVHGLVSQLRVALKETHLALTRSQVQVTSHTDVHAHVNMQKSRNKS